MKNLFPIMILLLMLTSQCKRKQIENKLGSKITIEEINIQPLPINNFNSLFTIKEFVVLKTPQNKPIGVINKVITTKNKIIVLDKMQDFIFIFDSEGNFLTVINQKGRGPNEYLSIEDFIWDKNKKQIIAIDRGGRKLICYDENGAFISSEELSFKPFSFFKKDENYWMYTNNYGLKSNFNSGNKKYYSLLNTDGKYQIKRMFNTIDNKLLGYSFSNSTVSSFTSINEKLFFTEFYSDTIFELNKEEITSKLFINYGTQAIPPNILKKTPANNLVSTIAKGSYSYTTGCYSLKDYLFLKGSHFNVLISTTDDDVIKFSRFENNVKVSVQYLGEDPFKKLAMFTVDMIDISNISDNQLYLDLIQQSKSNDYAIILFYEFNN